MTAIEETLRVDPTTMGVSAGAPGSPAHARGAMIGRFVVIEAIGQGAMGIVLGAYDPDLDRKVALKLLRPGAYDSSAAEGTERLQREARAMAKLSHPNVLAIHEVGVIDGGIFLATELAPGGTLHAWRLAESRSWRAVLEKFLQAGRGLAAAHVAGLVHRDFKPSNVLLDKDGNARVADFGLVAMAGHEPESPRPDKPASDDVSLTESGILLGTPAYMAPEQHGRGEIGPAADQFSFCVALWEALHGAPPFEGTSVMAIGENVRAGRVIAPGETDVPAWLRAVLRRGLSVEPRDRWPSMEALLAELARDPDTARRRQLAWAGGIAGVGLVALLIGYVATRSGSKELLCEAMDRQVAGVWDPARIAATRASFENSGAVDAGATFERFQKQLDAYTASWVDARRAACEATHVHGDQSTALLDLKVACLDRRLVAVDALLDVFAETPSPDAFDRAVSAAHALAPLESCADAEALRAAIPPPDDPATRSRVAAVRQQLASSKALAETGNFKRGRSVAQSAAAAAEQIAYAPLIAESLHRLGTLERLEGDGKAAEATFERALLAAATARDDLLAAEVWTELVYVIGQSLSRPGDALKMRTPALAALRRAGDDPMTEGNLIANLGRVLVADGKWADAQRLLEQALAIKERVSGVDSPDVGRLLLSLGITFLEQGKYERALVHYERARKIFEVAYGPQHVWVAGAINNLSTVYVGMGRFERALEGHELVLAMVTRSLGPDHPRVADSHQNIGDIQRRQGKLEEARGHFEKAIAIQTAKLGPDNPELAQNIANVGLVYLDQGHHERARVELVRALEIFDAALGDHPDTANPLVGLAAALFFLGNLDESRRHAERAVKIREAEQGAPEELAHVRLVLARTLLAANREQPRAFAMLAKAREVFVAQRAAGVERLKLVDDVLARHKR